MARRRGKKRNPDAQPLWKKTPKTRQGPTIQDPNRPDPPPRGGGSASFEAPPALSGLEYDQQEEDKLVFGYQKAKKIVNEKGCSHCHDVFKERGNHCPMCGLKWPDITGM